MFASFKKLFRKDTGEDLATSIPEVSLPGSATHSSGTLAKPVTVSFPSEQRSPIATAPASMASSDIVSLPVHSVIARLPNSMAGIVQSQGNGFFSLPALWVAQELPKGSVKLSFGELRQIAPLGTFFENTRHDQVLIELPLDEILTRLHPSHLARRKGQRQIMLPADIMNVFGPRGEGIMLSTAQPSGAKPVNPMPAAAPMAKPGHLEPVAMPDFKKSAVGETTTFQKPAVRVVPSESVAAERLAIPLAALAGSWPELINKELSTLNTAMVVLALPMDQLEQGLKTGKLIFSWKQICEWIQPPVSNSAVGEETLVDLPLKVIAPLFMAKHRPKTQKKIYIGDIPDLFAATAQTVPEESIPAAPAIVHAAPIKMALAVEPPAPAAPSLPIKLPVAELAVAPPITLSVETQAAPVPVLPKLETAPIPMPLPVPTIEPVKNEPATMREIFGQPSKTAWSPNEIVKNVATLPGITGAFVAMQDGLLVAAELPSHLKAETVAAFLPQIFGRMNQYAKELQLGALSSLSFVVEDVPWQIIKSKTVYLVAIGKSGESLPGAHLGTIAAELGQQIQ